MEELKYDDPLIDQEMRDYIKDLISCMTTGDEKQDMDSINTFAKTIAAQKNVSKEQAKEMLMTIR